MIQSCNYESNTFEEIKLQLWYVKIQLWSVKSFFTKAETSLYL